MAERKDDDRPFLRRWSERKRAGSREERAPEVELAEAPSTGEEAGEDTAAPAAEMSEEEISAKLAEIEEMKQGDDFKPLIQASMPEAVRRAALRRLWRANPIIGFRDGLNDYDLDYTNAATVVENLKTAYKVGKGYLTKEEPAEAEGGAQTQSAAESAPEAPQSETSNEFDDSAGREETLTSDETADAPPSASDEDDKAKPSPTSIAPADGEKRAEAEKPPETKAVEPGSAARRRWERFSA